MNNYFLQEVLDLERRSVEKCVRWKLKKWYQIDNVLIKATILQQMKLFEITGDGIPSILFLKRGPRQ